VSLDIGFLRLPIGGHSASMLSECIANRSYSWYPRPIKLAKRKRVRLSEVSGQDFVMYELPMPLDSTI